MNDEGFLVPADAPPATDRAFKIKALHMRDFGGLVRLAESKHVLSVFDSCFSGTIFTARAGAAPAAITSASNRNTRPAGVWDNGRPPESSAVMFHRSR